MNSSLRNYLDERSINDTLRDDLFALSGGAQGALAELVGSLRPSANTLRDIFRLGEEICLRDGSNWETLLAEPPARRALDPAVPLGSKDRTKELKRFLEQRRFPHTSAIEGEIEQLRKNLQRALGVTVEVPEDLEGDTFSVNLSFDSPERLGVLADAARGLAAHPDLERMFQLLKGRT